MSQNPAYNLANPVQGSAFSTFGTKPAYDNDMIISIGAPAVGDEFVTRNTAKDDVFVTVKAGVATFSEGQVSHKIGIGDIVSTSSGLLSLHRKITAKEWMVKDVFFGLAPEMTNATVTKIDKAYNSLNDMLGPGGGNIGTNIGADITGRGRLLVACYEMTDVMFGAEQMKDWVVDEKHYIRIFTPVNTFSECNVTQRHRGIFGSGYLASSDPTNLLAISQLDIGIPFTEIEGIAFDMNVVAGCSAVNINSDRVRITSCLSKAGYAGVLVDAVNGTNALVRGNIIDGTSTTGVYDPSGFSTILNNTIHDSLGSGVVVNTTTVLQNNLIQECSTACITPSGLAIVSIANATNDATGEIVLPVGERVYFRGPEDHHLDFNSNLYIDAMFGGVPPYGPNFFIQDIDGSFITGSGWHIGAHRYTPQQFFAISDDLSDIKTGSPSYEIDDGVMELTIPQTNDKLSIGCEVDDGTRKLYLYEKIDDSNWKVTTGSGLAPAGLSTPTPIVSIKPVWDNLTKPLFFDTSGPGIDDHISTAGNLVGSDVQVTLTVIDGDIPGITDIEDYQVDFNHYIKLYSPGKATEANTSRRHVGVFDADLPKITSSNSFTSSYMRVDGLQFSGGTSNISADPVYGGFSLVTNCIFKGNPLASTDGLTITPVDCNARQNYIITNNVVYSHSKSGIRLINDNDLTNISEVGIYNNTVVKCGTGILLETSDSGDSGYAETLITFKNNLMQGCFDYDFRSTTGASRFVDSEGNYSSDLTIRRTLSARNVPNTSLTFRDFKRDDFRVTMSDASKTSFATDLTVTFLPEAEYDNAGTSRYLYRVSAGANSWAPSSDTIVSFSLGSNKGSNMAPGGLTASIRNGVLEFSSYVSDEIGVGDKVTYDGSSVCYLSEKGNSLDWFVTDNRGAIPADIEGASLDDVTRVSDTLDNAVGSGTDVTDELDFGGSRDLTAYPEPINELRVWCYDDSGDDPGAVTITGWTVNPKENYIKVIVANDLETECNSTNRHDNTVNSGGFAVSPSSSTCIVIDNDQVHLDGMIVIPNSASDDAITINNNKLCEVTKNIINTANNGIVQAAGSIADGCVVAGNLVYECVNGIDVNGAYALNNTVYACSNNGIVADATSIVKNCIAQGSTTADFSGGILGGSISKCISEDASVNGLTDCLDSETLLFVNPVLKDFNLHRSDWQALNNGDQTPLTVPTYQVFGRFPFGSRAEYEISIGFNYNKVVETVEINLSNGPAGNFRTGVFPKVTITDGLAVFSEPQTNLAMGIGQCLDYDVDNKKAYLRKKLSSTSWEAVTLLGESPEDVSLVDLNSVENVFNDLIDIFRPTQANSIGRLIGNANNNFISTHAFRSKIIVNHYKAPDRDFENGGDVDSILVEDHISDSDNNLVLRTPFDVTSECNSKQRHNGVDDPSVTDMGRLVSSATTATSGLISVDVDFFEVDGFVINGVAPTVIPGWGILSTTGNDIVVSNCIISFFAEGISVLASDSTIVNNLVYETTTTGIDTQASEARVFNNTVIANTGKGINFQADSAIINNIVQGASTGDYEPALDNGMINCISSDATGNVASTNLTFEDAGNKNYNLNVSDEEAMGYGVPLSTFREVRFGYDLARVRRGRRWDLGALRYVPENQVKFSVGSSYGTDLATQGGMTYETVTVGTGVHAISIMTFSTPQTNTRLGAGDEVIDIGGQFPDGCYLFEKIDDSNWIVTTAFGEDVPTVSLSAGSISRAYSTITEAVRSTGIWTKMNILDFDLVSAGMKPTILCYNDQASVSPANATIVSHTSDINHFLTIKTPAEPTESNSVQRHNGTASSGYEHIGGAYGISAQKADFLEIDGLVLSSFDGNYFDSVIDISESATSSGEASKGVIITNNIIHDSNSHAIRVTSEQYVVGSKHVAHIFIANNIIYGCNGDGVTIGAPFELSGYSDFVQSNTIVNCYRGVYFRRMPSTNSGEILIRNNIVQDSRYADYVSDNLTEAGKFNLSNNISRDTTSQSHYPGDGVGNYSITRVQFLSRITNNYRASQEADYEVLDGGIDLMFSEDFLTDPLLRSRPYVDLSKDAVGFDREDDRWDIGAFESADVASDTESMDIGPVSIQVSTAIASETPPTLTLHLREHPDAPGDGINNEVEFDKIPDLNTFLFDYSSSYDGFDVEVHVEGGKEFKGSFEFRDKGSRNVTVKTRPSEIASGPGSIIYDGPVVDVNSTMYSLTFEDIKVYSHDTSGNDYLFDTPVGDGVSRLVFINSIVQVNKDAIVGADPAACKVALMNSVALYSNDDSSTTLSLAKNSGTRHLASNSIIMSYYASGDLEFITNPIPDANDRVRNCMAYNYYGSYGMTFSNPQSQRSGTIIDKNPEFEEATLIEQDFDIPVVMANKFKIINVSPAVDAGSDDFVGSNVQIFGSDTVDINSDIAGDDRRFESGVVDIGPYEIAIHNIIFKHEDIKQLFQDKLILDNKNQTYVSTNDSSTTYDIFDKFSQDPGKREEFSRESKIIFNLRQVDSDFRTFSDKKDTEIKVFEAYYDSSLKSIVTTKTEDLLGGMLSSIFDDGRYVFFFKEVENTLTVYENKTFDKGLSGSRNVVKNVKSGGPSVI